MINTDLKSNVFKVVVPQGGYFIYLPNHNVDYIQGNIASNCVPYEYDMLLSMLDFLKPGDTVLDVGANIGNHTIFLASIAKVNVVAFEPNVHLASAIQKSIEINALGSQVTVKQVGLGKEESVGSFNETIPDNLGAQSISIGDGNLQITTLDSMSFNAPISLIKIDVEGMELDVLKGAKNTLIKGKPNLYVEALSLDEFLKLESFLSELGYVILSSFNATPTHLFIHSSKLNHELIKKFNFEKTKGYVYQQPKELKELKEKLHQANIKYRKINEIVDKLKKEILVSKGEEQNISCIEDVLRKEVLPVLKELEQHFETNTNFQYKLSSQPLDVVAYLETLSEKIEQHLETNTNFHDKLSSQSLNVVAYLETISEKIEQEKNQLEQTLIKQRNENAALIERLGLKESLHEKAEKEADNLRKALEKKVVDLAKQSALHEKTESEKSTLENKLLNQSNELLDVSSRLLMKEALYEKSEGDLLTLEHKISNQSRELLKAVARLSETEVLYDECKSKKEGLLTKFRKQEKEIMDIKSKEIPQLKKDCVSAQLEIEALKEELKKAKEATNNAEIAKLKAVTQIDELRASIMFQLGYVLVNGCLSLKGFALLPFRLASIIKRGVGKLFSSKNETRGTNNSAKPLSFSSKLVTEGSPDLHLPSELKSNTAERYINSLSSNRKVACVMDEFTYSSYKSTCNLQQLTPENWSTELEKFQPELLFIESAWRGKDELWGSKVGHNSQELQDIVKWCKSKNIPTLFWNKEDPIHFQTFLNVAKQFDFVFTTDLDCVSRYKTILKHNKVYFLPFACQPTSHNPIEKYSRKDAISFAGAYYKKYPERTKDLENFVSILSDVKPLEIFDRNYGKSDENYMFPETYKPFIVGTLPFEKIDIAYKGYKYAINLNSIKQSQTMFARRVYELLASNTLTISNYSKGVRLLFGDLVLCSDSGEATKSRLLKCDSDKSYSDKLRVAGVRKALEEHTYQHRFEYIEEKVFGKVNSVQSSKVAVISFVSSYKEASRVVSSFKQQTYMNKSLWIICDSVTRGLEKLVSPSVQLISYQDAENKVLANLFKEYRYLATFESSDHYGSNYLKDLILHHFYLKVDIVGKYELYSYLDESVVHDNVGKSYQVVDGLFAQSSVVDFNAISDVKLSFWRALISESFGKGYTQFSSDRFNYCKNGKERSEAENIVNDIPNLNVGKNVKELQLIAEQAKPAKNNISEKLLDIDLLRPIFENANTKDVQLDFNERTIALSSTLKDGKHEYVYGSSLLNIEVFNPIQEQSECVIKLFIDATPGLSVSFVLIYLDENEQRLAHDIINTNLNKTLKVPFGCKYVKVGFRAFSAGGCQIKDIVLGSRELLPTKFVSTSDVLLVTNHYPSYDDLYRNGFVHSRVRSYQQYNMNLDVFRLHPGELNSYHEFEGVDVTTGGANVLRHILERGNYKTILVHFLDSHMWGVLKDLSKEIKINIWVHGSEVQPWWRRKYNYSDEKSLAIAKKESAIRQAFWKDVLNPFPSNLNFIFVSQYFADEVMEDLGVSFPDSQYEIIHNPIDTELFNYIEKPIEQRKKILSIRPYASAKYANDLSVEAVLLLSKESFFDDLEFLFVGDGKLFNETLEPLRNFENVSISKGFLKHSEIAELHKEFGVFLCPTRMDAQGVSKDEAMSSGLIPVSNAVTAIPEFIDVDSGILASAESAVEMAQGIKSIYLDSNKFRVLSRNAAHRVRRQTCSSIVIAQEIDVVKRK